VCSTLSWENYLTAGEVEGMWKRRAKKHRKGTG